MGSVGDAYNNAICESFFAKLECELLGHCRFRPQAEARAVIFEFTEGLYNLGRRRSGIEYLLPIAYERWHHEIVAVPGGPQPAAELAAIRALRAAFGGRLRRSSAAAARGHAGILKS
jgi:hypothetical protein